MSRKPSKRYLEALTAVDREREYSSEEAFALLKELPAAKFDETVEVHLRLGIDPRHADQMVRGSLKLPHGTGKVPRVVVFAQGEQAREAEEAGADSVGGADLAAKVEQGWFEFDVAIATPDAMNLVAKLGRVLGPRGLMPNPKAGTVTFEVGKAVADVKAGKVEYRTDRTGNMHLPLGKRSFDIKRLAENYATVIEEVVRAKPAAAKGRYLRGITVATTMSPGIALETPK